MAAQTPAAEGNSLFIQILGFFSNSGFETLEIIIIIIFGVLIIKLLMKLIKQALLSSSIDRSLIPFVSAITEFVFALVLAMYCLAKMKINITGIIAMVSALGLAIGLALQDLIGGIANGLVIINTKPFKVDDYVAIGEQSGTVRSITLLHTVLVTVDNKKIVLTNKEVYNSEIINYSAFANRRLDMNFSIDYGASIDLAKEIIRKDVEKNPLVLKNPKPFVRLTSDEDSALIITLRAWVRSENFWNVNFDLKEQILKDLVAAGIEIPFNQLTVSFRPDDPVLQAILKARKEDANA